MNKKQQNEAIKKFFHFYVGNIEGMMNHMTIGELEEYLTPDIFVGCASAATGIPEEKFTEWALNNVGNLMQ